MGQLWTEEELESQVKTYMDMPIYETPGSTVVVGKVISAKWNAKEKCIDATIKLDAEYAAKVDKMGAKEDCSIGSTLN